MRTSPADAGPAKNNCLFWTGLIPEAKLHRARFPPINGSLNGGAIGLKTAGLASGRFRIGGLRSNTFGVRNDRVE